MKGSLKTSWNRKVVFKCLQQVIWRESLHLMLRPADILRAIFANLDGGFFSFFCLKSELALDLTDRLDVGCLRSFFKLGSQNGSEVSKFATFIVHGESLSGSQFAQSSSSASYEETDSNSSS